MVRQPQGTEWMGDFNAMGEQFWTALQKGVGQFGATAPNNPAMEQWQSMLEQARASKTGHGEMFERGVEGVRQYVDFMQNALQQVGAHSGTAFDPTQLMRGAFRAFDVRQNPVVSALRASVGHGALNVDRLLDGVKQFTEPFRQQMASGMSMPAFGQHREEIERNQALARALVELQEPMGLYQAEMLQAARRGLEIFELKLAERAEPGRELSSMRALYDLWIDAAEEGYAEVALSPGFRKAYGAMANAQMRVRQLIQQQVERSTAAFGMPGRTEMDSVLRQLADLRRRLGDAEEQLRPQRPSGPRREKAAGVDLDIPKSDMRMQERREFARERRAAEKRRLAKNDRRARAPVAKAPDPVKAIVADTTKVGARSVTSRKPVKARKSEKRGKAAKSATVSTPTRSTKVKPINASMAAKARKTTKASKARKSTTGGSFAERLAAARTDKRKG